MKTITFSYEDVEGFHRYADAEYNGHLLTNIRSHATGKPLGLGSMLINDFCPDCHYLTGEFTSEGLKFTIRKKRTREQIQNTIIMLASFLNSKFHKL